MNIWMSYKRDFNGLGTHSIAVAAAAAANRTLMARLREPSTTLSLQDQSRIADMLDSLRLPLT